MDSTLDTAEERISKLEERSVEITILNHREKKKRMENVRVRETYETQ